MPVSALGLGLGLAGAIGKFASAGEANQQLQGLIGQDPAYSANPIAAQRLGLAQTLLNARQPGAVSAERNISGAQGGANADIQRNATSGSQAIAAEAGAQGTTDQNIQKLQQNEAAGYQTRYANLAGAEEGSISEGDKVFQSQLRQFQDKAQIMGAQAANRMNMWGSLSNLGFGAANFGAAMKPPNIGGSGGYPQLQ